MSAKTTSKKNGGYFIDLSKIKDEANLSVRQMMAAKDDICFTYIHRIGRFSVYNQKEFLPQMKEWKRLGVKALACNVKEREMAGHKVWLLVVQPEKLEDGPVMCPLGAACDLMVSGYTYVVKDKSLADMVVRYLA